VKRVAQDKTNLERRIESGKPLLLAEIKPPVGIDPAPVRAMARRCAGKVHALGVSDNRDRVLMSAMAASVLVAGEGVEPILHVVTRDRNRIALVSDCLGAQALGISNLLCTSGSHQTLGRYADAKSVFDIDVVQLLEVFSTLAANGSVVGEERIEGAGPFCLGGVAAPYADPLEMQVARLAKKAAAGARFLITQPVYDMERFVAWWNEVTRRGIHEKVAIVAGIQPLGEAAKAKQYAVKRPVPRVPQAMLERLASKPDAGAQRAEGIQIAVETIGRLSELRGLRGFEVCGDGDLDAALEVIERSGLKPD
jgi:methylenetetrahydrofolate reductase (NADPH)